MKKKGLTIAALLLALVLLANSLVITQENQFTVIKQFGRVVKIVEQAGPSFKIPFVQQTQKIPNMTQLYDLAVSDVITKDKKTMVADCFVLWRIEDSTKFITSLNASVEGAEGRINTLVYNSLKNVISSLNQEDVISGRDGELAAAILRNIGNSMDEYGIVITAVETKMLDLPDDNKAAVYERMISERNNIAAAYTAEGESEAKKIRNQTDADIEITLSKANADAQQLIAEGEAEYMRILSEAYNDPLKAEFYEFVRSLDAAKESFKSEDNVLILDKDSPLAQIFYGR